MTAMLIYNNFFFSSTSVVLSLKAAVFTKLNSDQSSRLLYWSYLLLLKTGCRMTPPVVKRGLMISALACSWPILYPFMPVLAFKGKKSKSSSLLCLHFMYL